MPNSSVNVNKMFYIVIQNSNFVNVECANWKSHYYRFRWSGRNLHLVSGHFQLNNRASQLIEIYNV